MALARYRDHCKMDCDYSRCSGSGCRHLQVCDEAMKPLYHALTAIITGIIVGPLTWELTDREPPYIRESGEIVPVDHRMCGLEKGPINDGLIHPGSCVEVKWTIVPLRTCKPYGKFSVTRMIVDQQGRHNLPATNSLYSSRSNVIPPAEPSTEGLIRYFALPSNGPVGPATYESSAAFSCNKLQEFFWPIIVNTPSIQFTVGELPTTRGAR